MLDYMSNCMVQFIFMSFELVTCFNVRVSFVYRHTCVI